MSGSGIRPPGAAPLDPTIDRPTTPVSEPGVLVEAAETSGSVERNDRVTLSDRAQIAEQMMQGALDHQNGVPDSHLEGLAHTVAAGDYRPPAMDVAKAMIAFETRVRKARPRG